MFASLSATKSSNRSVRGVSQCSGRENGTKRPVRASARVQALRTPQLLSTVAQRDLTPATAIRYVDADGHFGTHRENQARRRAP